jgi:heme A synthase
MNIFIYVNSFLLTILCTIAQGYCIYTTFTKNSSYGAIEETIWGVSHALMAPCVLYLLVQYSLFDGRRINAEKIDLSQTQTYLFLLLCYTVCLAVYNLFYHVPILYQLAADDDMKGKKYYTLYKGMLNSMTERNCSKQFF